MKAVQLRHVFNVTSGATPESGKPEYWDGNVAWITPEDLSGIEVGYQMHETKRRITQEGYGSCGTRLAPKGSIVLTKRAPIGQLAILNINACSNQECLLLTEKKVSDSRYFYYFLLSQCDWLQALGRGSTFMELSLDDLKSYKVPILSSDYQRAIADYLDRETAKLDALIAAKESLWDLLAEKRRALITHAVTRSLNPDVPLCDSAISWLGFIPEHWQIKRAKFLFRQSALSVQNEDEMVTCFRDGQVTLRKNRREEGFTNAVKELGYQGIQPGQLVLHSMDAFAGAIGVSDAQGKCSPEYIICDPIHEDTINHYYGHLLRVMALNGFIQACCPAVRERAPRIRFSDFGEMYLPVPPSEEQQAIVAHIKQETAKLDALKQAAERTIGLLKERRAALIAAAVTGKIEI